MAARQFAEANAIPGPSSPPSVLRQRDEVAALGLVLPGVLQAGQH
jgi:hypothetical protein